MSTTGFDKWIKENHTLVLEHGLLAIDPSSGSESSQPGYAVYVRGRRVAGGVFTINPRLPIHLRLSQLYSEVRNLVTAYDVATLSVERIRGRMAHEYLRWAVGVILAAGGQKIKTAVEVPIPVWKKYSKNDPSYTKGDANDARIMGDCIHAMARAERDRHNKVGSQRDSGLLSGDTAPTTGGRTKRAGGEVGERRRSGDKRARRNRQIADRVLRR